MVYRQNAGGQNGRQNAQNAGVCVLVPALTHKCVLLNDDCNHSEILVHLKII